MTHAGQTTNKCVTVGTWYAPGRHTVEFRYEPLSWRLGWIVSLLALIGLVAAVVAGLRRRRA